MSDQEIRTLWRECVAGEPEAFAKLVTILYRSGQWPVLKGVGEAKRFLKDAAAHHETQKLKPEGRILAWSIENGDYAEEHGWVLFEQDGAFILVDGGCDSTGWDCQSSAGEAIYQDIGTAVLAMSQEQRATLLTAL